MEGGQIPLAFLQQHLRDKDDGGIAESSLDLSPAPRSTAPLAAEVQAPSFNRYDFPNRFPLKTFS